MEAATTPASPVSTSTNGGAPGRGPRSYDAIIVGGGHNGLTTTAYLARAGIRWSASSAATSSAARA